LEKALRFLKNFLLKDFIDRENLKVASFDLELMFLETRPKSFNMV